MPPDMELEEDLEDLDFSVQQLVNLNKIRISHAFKEQDAGSSEEACHACIAQELIPCATSLVDVLAWSSSCVMEGIRCVRTSWHFLWLPDRSLIFQMKPCRRHGAFRNLCYRHWFFITFQTKGSDRPPGRRLISSTIKVTKWGLFHEDLLGGRCLCFSSKQRSHSTRRGPIAQHWILRNLFLRACRSPVVDDCSW